MAQALGNNGGRFYSYANQPVLIDCSFVVDLANGNGLGIRSLKGQGVRNVYMRTSATPAKGAAPTITNPLSVAGSAGYALIQLRHAANRYLGGFNGFVSPTSGSALAITASAAALTAGIPYTLASVGHAPAGTVTIAPVADVSGSLASKYFTLWDSYGNTWVIWFSVAGVGTRPNLGTAAADGAVGLHYVQQSIASGATAAAIGTALAVTIPALPSGIASVYSFTASGTTTVTVVSTAYGPLPGVPADGVSGSTTGFTFAQTVTESLLSGWQGVGLPKGLTPTVGQTFVAANTGAGASTGTVIAAGVSGITSVEVIGDPNTTLASGPMLGSSYPGGWIMIQFLGATGASTTTLIPKAPADGSVVGLSFWVDQKFSPSNNNAHTI
jgi:hypothetical protein